MFPQILDESLRLAPNFNLAKLAKDAIINKKRLKNKINNFTKFLHGLQVPSTFHLLI